MVRKLSYVLLLAACGSTHKPAGDAPTQGPVLQRASRSSTIALTDDGAHVAMVNPEDGSLSVFETTDDARTAKVATGGSPSSVALAPDRDRKSTRLNSSHSSI